MGDGAGTKPTLILVHAAGRGGRSWRGVVPLLADEFDVLTPDLPGFAGAPGPFRMADAVASIADLAATHRPPVLLCGLSLGASVAAVVAANHPELVDRAVLSAPAIRTSDHDTAVRWYRRAPGWAVRAVTDLPDRAAWVALIDAMVAIDLTETLPRISAPTLVLCGGRDKANLAEAELAGRTIPRGSFALVPHVGHAWPVTRPSLFATVVRPFLTASARSGA
jgi:pimeloyl-ACP methyl ester carboxylesterase